LYRTTDFAGKKGVSTKKAAAPKKPASKKSGSKKASVPTTAQSPESQVTGEDTQPKVKPTHLRYSSGRQIQTKKHSVAEIEAAIAEWVKLVANHHVRSDGVLFNVDKVVQYLSNYELQYMVETTRPGDADRTIESLLNTQPLPHRNKEKLKQSSFEGKDSWRLRYKTDNGGAYKAGGTNFISDMVTFGLVSKGHTATMNKVADEFIEIHNIWPYSQTDATTRSLFAVIAVKRATGQDQKLVQQPNYNNSPNYHLLQTHVRFIVREIGLARRHIISLKPAVSMQSCLPIPNLPQTVVLWKPNTSKGVEVLKKDE
jgi:hypothetical protein